MTTPQYDGYQPSDAAQPVSDSDRNSAGLIHLLGGIFGVILALILWLVLKDKSAFVDAEGKKALNFQIWVFIASVVLGITIVVPIAAWIIGLVYGIKNYQAVNAGQPTKYLIDTAIVK